MLLGNEIWSSEQPNRNAFGLSSKLNTIKKMYIVIINQTLPKHDEWDHFPPIDSSTSYQETSAWARSWVLRRRCHSNSTCTWFRGWLYPKILQSGRRLWSPAPGTGLRAEPNRSRNATGSTGTNAVPFIHYMQLSTACKSMVTFSTSTDN